MLWTADLEMLKDFYECVVLDPENNRIEITI